MARSLIIVHGYSDGYMKKANSFKKLENYLVREGLYARRDVHFVEYSSMDDQATFEDFADKLNGDYESKFAGKRVDVLCHSTGSLVVRAWLKLRRERQRRRGVALDVPVARLFCFAPANFGSDLAQMGQSFLGKVRSTFFNRSAHRKEAFESGKIVLQGLEPASPYQWALSGYDLHEETYFGPDDPSGQTCYPFIFAAGEGYGGMQSKVVRARNKPGTDGTVRICGTSMNTRKCALEFMDGDTRMSWAREPKHAAMPFAVFQGFNHGSIINATEEGFDAEDGPGPMLQAAMKVRTPAQYAKAAHMFEEVSARNYARATGAAAAVYQQFYFKMRDDAGFDVYDFFIDFVVVDQDGRKLQRLSSRFDDVFETRVTRHSADPSLRAFLINLTELSSVLDEITEAGACIRLDLEARRPYDEVSYGSPSWVVFNALTEDESPVFLYPNTTTLVEIVLNRQPSNKILRIMRG